MNQILEISSPWGVHMLLKLLVFFPGPLRMFRELQ